MKRLYTILVILMLTAPFAVGAGHHRTLLPPRQGAVPSAKAGLLESVRSYFRLLPEGLPSVVDIIT